MEILSPHASFHASVLCQCKEEQTVGVGLPKMTPKPRWRIQVVSNTEPAAHLTLLYQDQVPQKSILRSTAPLIVTLVLNSHL